MGRVILSGDFVVLRIKSYYWVAEMLNSPDHTQPLPFLNRLRSPFYVHLFKNPR